MPKLYKQPEDTFDYDDVILIPEECIIKSRSEVSTVATLGNKTFNLPVIPANMSTIVNEDTCIWLAEQNLFYIMHRFDIDPIKFTQTMHAKNLYASISLGIREADFTVVEEFKKLELTPEYITVDVAHGDSRYVFEIIKHIKKNLPDTQVIAGNVATRNGARRLAEAGADVLKIGIGPGSACLTAPNTGFGSQGHQLSTVADIAPKLKAQYPDIKIIADGGIRQYGDIAKSIAFGADMVMIGGMLAGHDENPGDVLDINGEKRKAFFGSASEHQKGEKKHVEGQMLYMPYKGSLVNTLQIIKENLQSSVSYAGGKELNDLRKVSYVRIDK